jgi:HK97 family phage major capsid protein
MTADTQIRDRLKEVRDQLSDARDRRAAAKKERDACKEAFAGVEITGRKLTDIPEFKSAEEAVRNLGEIDDEINDLKNAESGVLQLLGERVDPSPARNGNGMGADGVPTRPWDGHSLLSLSEDYKRAKEVGLFNSRAQFGTVNFGEIATREDAARFVSQGPSALQMHAAGLPAAPAADISRTGWSIQPDFRGVLPPLLRQLNLLDLIPTGTTDSNVIEYVQVTAIPGTAAPVAELSVKPQEGLTSAPATATVRTIAGYIKASRQSLDDVAGLATLINTLLPYDVRRVVEAQVLAGDGTGQNLQGLFNTTGIAKPTLNAGDNVADSILQAMVAIILSFGEPNFVAMNPVTWQGLMSARTEEGGAHTGQYMYGGPGSLNQPPTIWGLPMVNSVVIPQATPLVGDSNGCTLLVREGLNVKTSDSDQDDFVRNRVTVLAETRVTFVVWRPSVFAVAAQG